MQEGTLALVYRREGRKEGRTWARGRWEGAIKAQATTCDQRVQDTGNLLFANLICQLLHCRFEKTHGLRLVNKRLIYSD